jgi:hypothetical protein
LLWGVKKTAEMCSYKSILAWGGRNGKSQKTMKRSLELRLRARWQASFRAGKMGRARGYGAHRQMTNGKTPPTSAH